MCEDNKWDEKKKKRKKKKCAGFTFFFFVVRCEPVRVVVMCTLLFPMVSTVVYTAPSSHGISSAPLRVEVVSGLVREDNFVPSRRFREDGLEALKLSSGGGRQSKPSWRSRRGEIHEAY